MTMDSTLQALLTEATPAIWGALQRAFEAGYREGLASTGSTRESEASHGAPAAIGADPFGLSAGSADADDDLEPLDSAAPPPNDDTAQEDSSPSAIGADESPRAVDWGGGTRDRARARAQAPRAGIFPHATVGTLRSRIIDFFDLDRFSIDVVICRKGDRTRRQLKQSVKLSKYLVGE